MLRRMLVVVVMAAAGPATAVVGDLNLDGVVDLKDFFMLADNFGEEGPPGEAEDCGDPLPDDGSVVTGLGSVELRSSFWRPQSWDADLEDDGVEISWWLKSAEGGFLLSSVLPATAVHDVTISFWVRDRDLTEKKFDEPFWVLQFTTLAREYTIRVPFEDFRHLVPPAEVHAASPTSSLATRVYVVAELFITQADGSTFASRLDNSNLAIE